ncbi:hypothetical protein LDENG_00226720 [Lucifuga dentata]|nr:hypothetical protein LDENG_00226720 [Lucifuga dentata]
MSSVLLLLLLAALAAARLRRGGAEGDPLPASLVDLVRNSPISSIDDLKLLLQQETNAIEEEEDEDEHNVLTNQTHGRYARSLMEAPPAQQAVCKVRTEVMEVTRAMLDRRNANFLLWPPCVEVQRCSGCCNTRLLQCVPTVSTTRYLQVIKIQYINKKAHYDKAVISVEDHVSCRCQTLSSSSSSSSLSIPRSSVSAKTNPPPPPLQQPPPPSPHLPLPPPRPVHPSQPKSHTSKADLHRHDDLKHNQQHHQPEDPAARQWQQGRFTQLLHWTQPRLHQTPPHVQADAHTQTQPIARGAEPAGNWPSEARAEHSIMGNPQLVPREGGQGSGYDGNREESSVRNVHHADYTQRLQQQQYHHHHHHHHQQQQQQLYPYQQHSHRPSLEDQELRTQYRLNAPQSDGAFPPSNPTQPANQESAQNRSPTNQKTGELTTNSQKSSDDTAPRQTETEVANHKEGNEREESGSTNSGDSAGAELANQEKEKDSKVTERGGHFTEEERRQKLLEVTQKEPDEQTHLHPHHPHHPQQRPKPTSLRTVRPTVVASSPSARRDPLRLASPRRRRKHQLQRTQHEPKGCSGSKTSLRNYKCGFLECWTFWTDSRDH